MQMAPAINPPAAVLQEEEKGIEHGNVQDPHWDIPEEMLSGRLENSRHVGEQQPGN